MEEVACFKITSFVVMNLIIVITTYFTIIKLVIATITITTIAPIVNIKEIIIM